MFLVVVAMVVRSEVKSGGGGMNEKIIYPF
jgi:hypothetical protein